MDKDKIDLEIRLTALEQFVYEVGKVAFIKAGLDPDQIGQYAENAYQKISSDTLPGVDPAQADHAVDEVAKAVNEHFLHVRNLVQASLSELERQQGLPPHSD